MGASKGAVKPVRKTRKGAPSEPVEALRTKAKPGPKPREDYDARASDLANKRAKRSESRDVKIPEIVNPRRRARCSKSLFLFAKTYFFGAMYLKPSESHKEIANELQDRIRYGGKRAIAAPRGFGKDTWLKIAALWAILYGYASFFLVVLSCYKDAEEFVEDLKEELETNDLLLEDFPEVCAPIRALEGAAQRANSQTVNGQRTRIRWGKGEVRFPVIEGSISSGAWIVARGIDGKLRGITRGKKRPDFNLVNDLESEESVDSEATTVKLEKKIDNALGGVSGPGKKVSAFMLCTIIKRGCLADRYTDPGQKPAWNGVRYKALIRPPEREDLWEQYVELRRAGGKSGEDTKGRAAHRFYLEHRKEMDRGALVIWPANFIAEKLADGTREEVSALQHLYNIVADFGENFFATEHQNDPPEDTEEKGFGITADLVQQRVNGNPHLVVPEGYTKLTQFIDIRQTEMHYAVVAWNAESTGVFVDYAWEKYPVEIDADLQQVSMRTPLRAKIMTVLRGRREAIAAGLIVNNDGNPVSVDLTLVDANYMSDVVLQFCREAGSRWRPSYGRSRGHRLGAFNRPDPREDTKIGAHWFAKFDKGDGVWRWFLDADYFKHAVHEGFLQAVGTPGSLSLFGHEPKDHRMFARHICAEHWNPEKDRWEGSKWNHFLDCAYGCCAGASMLGIRRVRPEAQGQREQPKSEHRAVVGQVQWIKRGGR